MRRASDGLDKLRPKKPITQKQLDARRRNIVKAQEARTGKRKSYRLNKKVLNATTIDIPPQIISDNNGQHVVMSAEDYSSIEEVLQNCALAGLALTRCPSMLESTEAIKSVGAAIGEVCLEGITLLKNVRIYKKPGRKKRD